MENNNSNLLSTPKTLNFPPDNQFVKCGDCQGDLVPVFAQKPDGGLVFPAYVKEFQHVGNQPCKRPRKTTKAAKVHAVNPALAG